MPRLSALHWKMRLGQKSRCGTCLCLCRARATVHSWASLPHMLRPHYCLIILSSDHLARYTWDCNTNRNIQSSFMLGRTAGPRCRFDRCYFKAAPLQSGVQLELVGKDLVGLETVDVHLPPLLPVLIGRDVHLTAPSTRTNRTRCVPPTYQPDAPRPSPRTSIAPASFHLFRFTFG
jgi:hypothetical protein